MEIFKPKKYQKILFPGYQIWEILMELKLKQFNMKVSTNLRNAWKLIFHLTFINNFAEIYCSSSYFLSPEKLWKLKRLPKYLCNDDF